ncbi:hypothetical protein ACTXLK_11590 [Psychrobacter faecalis]
MSHNFKMSLILPFLFISSCSQFEANEKQEQEPITVQTSMTAALDGYLHFTDNCIIVRPEGEKGTQLAILGDQVISDLTENSLVYQGKKYTEGDYIRVGGGGVVGDSDAFKKERNLDKCSDLEIFIPN